MSGCDNWDDIELFGKRQLHWLRKFGEFKHGVPSHDTINRVVSSISPDQFNECFILWVKDILRGMSDELIAIDGKRMRGSYDSSLGKPAIHMVSAYASQYGLCMGQVSTDEKSNEITAIPELLINLDINGCSVTIDAMGCQTTIAEQIIDQGADYILAVKGNQASLQQGIEDIILFDKPMDTDTRIDVGHGRIETRTCSVYKTSDLIENLDRWKEISHVLQVETKRIDKRTGRQEVEKRHYITSKKTDAAQFNQDIRNHWAIENNLHWVLDVSFGEDASRKRARYAAQNFNIITKVALTFLSNDTTPRMSNKRKRLAAALDYKYREKLLMI